MTVHDVVPLPFQKSLNFQTKFKISKKSQVFQKKKFKNSNFFEISNVPKSLKIQTFSCTTRDPWLKESFVVCVCVHVCGFTFFFIYVIMFLFRFPLFGHYCFHLFVNFHYFISITCPHPPKKQ